MLEVDGLTVRYGGVLAVQDVSLHVEAGESVGLVGANGAGKSTVLRAISGLLRFHHGRCVAGDLRFDGRSIAGAAPAALVQAGIAQVLEGRRIFADLTVEENLRVGAFAPRARRAAAARQAEMLELFPVLGQRLDQPGGLLSGGEQQMLAIARALMAQPRLLLLDEPSLGVAPILVVEIAQALRRIAGAGTALLVVTQSTALAQAATSRAYLLETGRVRAEGATHELVQEDRVRASYLGTTAGAEVVA